MSINNIIKEIQKTHGENIIKKASELPQIKVMPCGIPLVDYQFGGGLSVLGRTSMIAGIENSGKSSLAMYQAKEFQKRGFPVFWIDLDKKFDQERARTFGLDVENLNVIRGELTAEMTYEIGRDLIRALNAQDDKRGFIVLDSIAEMISEALFDKTASTQFGGSARMINQAVQVFQQLINENQSVLLINEFRKKIGDMGEDNMLPGGMAQQYVATNILWLRNGITFKDGTLPIGQEVKWTIKKSKMSAPKVGGTVNFSYKEGYDVYTSLFDTAIEMGIIEKAGSWLTVPNSTERIQGKDKLVARLKEDKEYLDSLWNLVYSKMNKPIWDEIKPEPVEEVTETKKSKKKDVE